MLPRPLRLSRKGFSESRGLLRASSPHFGISYGMVTEGRGGSAVIVPKKVVKSSVGRHLLKRRIRAVTRSVSSRELVLIVTAKRGSDTLTYQELERELLPVFGSILHK